MHSRSRGGYETDAEEQDASGSTAPLGIIPLHCRSVIAGEKLLERIARAVCESPGVEERKVKFAHDNTTNFL